MELPLALNEDVQHVMCDEAGYQGTSFRFGVQAWSPLHYPVAWASRVDMPALLPRIADQGDALANAGARNA